MTEAQTDPLIEAAQALRTQVASAVVILRYYQVGGPVADMLEKAVNAFDEAAALAAMQPHERQNFQRVMGQRAVVKRIAEKQIREGE